jgi:hypothetical protein
MINKTEQPWTQEDLQFKEVASKRCKTKYTSKHCLKTFIKNSTQRDYSVICGKET